MSVEAEREAEAGIADRYRREAADFRSEAVVRRREAQDLDARAADLIVLAASIERSHRGIPPLPPAGLSATHEGDTPCATN